MSEAFRRQFYQIIIVCVTVFFAVGLFGCGINTSTGSVDDPLRVLLIYQSDTWVQDINIMHQIADAIEEELSDHSEVAFSSYGIQSVSVSDSVQIAIDMQTDVLIFYSFSSESALEAYAKLEEEGIRLILVDGDVEESGRYAYIGTDNSQAGIQACDLIVENCGQDVSIAVLMPDLGTSLCSVKSRVEGFDSAADECGLNIVARCETSYNSLTAISNIESLLDEYPEISVLYCAEAVSGQAAADVVLDRGLENDIYVITYDINDNIEADLANGAVDVTFIQNTETIGMNVVKALLELANDRSLVKGADLLFDCTVMTAKERTQSDEEKK